MTTGTERTLPAEPCTYPDCTCSPLDAGKPRERCGKAQVAPDELEERYQQIMGEWKVGRLSP